MNKRDYLAQVEALHASPELRARVAGLAGTARRRRFRPWIAVCACLAVVLGLGAGVVSGLLPGLPIGGSSAGGGGHDEGSVFLSYAGPVFPLATLEDTALTAVRDITLDFAPWERVWRAEPELDEGGYYTSSSDVLVTDSYVLTNPTDADQAVTLLYPYAGSFLLEADQIPVLTAAGAELETVSHAGPYSGGFTGAWGSSQPEAGSLNLYELDSWEGYRALLEDGAYQTQALGGAPDLSGIPVTVYRFTDPWGPERSDEIPNPTIRVSFDLDYDRTTVLSYGFHGASFAPETDHMVQSFSIPQPEDRLCGRPYFLIVLGDDLANLTTQGYVTGGFDPDRTVESGVTVTRSESDLDTVLREIVALSRDSGWAANLPDTLQTDFELYYRAVCEHLLTFGLLSETPVERYDLGWLEDVISEVGGVDRVFYLEAQLTVPAGESVTVEAVFRKEASFDFYCAHTGNRGVYGYDLVTRLGSTLDFTGQSARLLDRGLVEIVRQNFGFDPEAGVTRVELDPAQEHYYLEVRRAGS